MVHGIMSAASICRNMPMSLASVGTLASWQTAQGWHPPCRWLKASACCIASQPTECSGSPKGIKSPDWSGAKLNAKPIWKADWNLIRFGNEPFRDRQSASTAWKNKAAVQGAANEFGKISVVVTNAGWKSDGGENESGENLRKNGKNQENSLVGFGLRRFYLIFIKNEPWGVAKNAIFIFLIFVWYCEWTTCLYWHKILNMRYCLGDQDRRKCATGEMKISLAAFLFMNYRLFWPPLDADSTCSIIKPPKSLVNLFPF